MIGNESRKMPHREQTRQIISPGIRFSRRIALLFSAGFFFAVASTLLSAESKLSMKIALTSSAFQAGAAIPRKYTCDGEDISPSLRWGRAPEGTLSFALIVDDPDAPGGTWVHWVLYDLPAGTRELKEGAAKTETLANGATQGENDFHKIGYGGPCPPPGSAHRYSFRIYALDAVTSLKARARKPQLLEAMKGHVLGSGELIGRYKR
jgi:Raf kinase inhibitor-like YbhB/YbcL family protein